MTAEDQSKKNEKEEEQPEIRVMSVREVRQYDRKQRRYRLMVRKRADLVLRSDVSEGFETVLDELDKLEEKMEQAQREMNAQVVKCIVHIPQDWLEDNAPTDLDWNDVDSLDYLRYDKLVELTKISSGQAADDAAGN